MTNSNSDRVERAVALFAEGYNCAQAVFSTFAPEYGLDIETALRIADPLGAGIGKMGETCGAVSGAFLAIGLCHGRREADDVEAKERAYELAREFAHRFRQRHGTLLCRELLGHDISTDEGLAAAQEADLFATRCPDLVRDAVEIVEQLLC